MNLLWRCVPGRLCPMAAGVVAGLWLTAAGPCARAQTFAPGGIVGEVNAWQISEASGLAASRQNGGVLWTHNDSGWAGTVFALATNGALLGLYQVPGASFGDYEDIAIGPGPSPRMQYIYLGDIGDNFSTREVIRVYRFPEPAVYGYQTNLPPNRLLAETESFVLRYPDGPHNCEAMMVDPVTGDLFLATKHTNSSRIYRAARATLQSEAEVQLSFLREISFRSVSAGDITADGSLIALRRAGRVDVWPRQPGQSVGAALGGSSIRAQVIGQPTEPNGEAIAFDATGLGYYTLSEGFSQPLYYFHRTDAGVPSPPREFVAPGQVWHFEDSGTDFGTNWIAADFPAGDWPSGPARLGYGEAGEITTVSFGFDDVFKNVTTYFRRPFVAPSTNGLTQLALRVCYSDGLAVYLNGAEVLRQDLPPGAGFDEPATRDAGPRANVWQSFPVPPSLLCNGTNTLAVELHRFDPGGPTLGFDLQLVEARVDAPLRFTSAPQWSNAVARLFIGGPVGFEAAVEKSEDLAAWLPLTTVTLTNGSAAAIDAAPVTAARFYRLR